MKPSLANAIVRRADGLCEACRVRPAARIDHFFSRGRAESLETCWHLCVECDIDKTYNRPAASHWLLSFVCHAESHGYTAAAERARARLEGIVAVREREAGSTRQVAK